MEIDNVIRTSMLAFAMKAHAQLHQGKELTPHAYVTHVVSHLECVARGETKRLILALPPRHAKTFLGSICLTAWILAHNPAAKILLVSYGQDLADKIAYSIRAILQSDWFLRLFKTKIAKNRSKLMDFVTTAGGGVRSVSVEGGVTGLGADFIVIDDPLQIKDFDNDKQIERINDLFDSEVRTRLDNPKKGTIIIVAHRLAENDLAGHALLEGGWKYIRLPLIAPRRHRYKYNDVVWDRKRGELLRPDAFAPKDIKKLRSMKGPGFETLQQQNPGASDRLRIKTEHFGVFDPATLPSDKAVVLSIDPGQKGGRETSFGVVQAWASYQGKYALLDQWRGRASYKEFRHEVFRFNRRYRPSAILVEATGQGPALISEINPHYGMELVQVTPFDDKFSRLRPHLKSLRAGIVLLPKSAPWLEEFLAEIIFFPYGPFDDQVDAMTQFLGWITQNRYPQQRPLQAMIAGRSSSGHVLPLTGRPPRMEFLGGVLAQRRPRW